MEVRKEMTTMVLTVTVALFVLVLFLGAGKADHEIKGEHRHGRRT